MLTCCIALLTVVLQGNYKNGFVYWIILMITFWILYSYLVPISLFVTLEIVKFWQGFLYINRDKEMKVKLFSKSHLAPVMTLHHAHLAICAFACCAVLYKQRSCHDMQQKLCDLCMHYLPPPPCLPHLLYCLCDAAYLRPPCNVRQTQLLFVYMHHVPGACSTNRTPQHLNSRLATRHQCACAAPKHDGCTLVNLTASALQQAADQETQ